MPIVYRFGMSRDYASLNPGMPERRHGGQAKVIERYQQAMEAYSKLSAEERPCWAEFLANHKKAEN